ncbi:MAG: PASTA domain-containing protein [Huintestinicola sp.]|uniref:PASTA domain-containing protein n=1 Tax=Huintestinicola sp. TaxID=2981661 RepID=UPI003F023716
MGFCGTQYINEMMFWFLAALITLAMFAVSLLWIKHNRNTKKKTTTSVISASVSALLAVYPVTAFVILFLNPPGVQRLDPMVDLTGYDYNYCKTYYAEYFELSVSGEEYSDEYPKGTIIRHEPRAKVPIIRGSSEVRCVVSKGVRQVAVCNVIALNVETAEKMLAANELEYEIKYEPSEEYEEGIVISTEPERNTEVPVGSTVTLYVSGGKE